MTPPSSGRHCHAFVATVYGVGSANILFLPIANKVKRKLSLDKERSTLIAEVCSLFRPDLIPGCWKRRSAPTPRPHQAFGQELDHGKETTRRGTREPRALAGFLCRLHDSALCLLRGHVFGQPHRSEAHVEVVKSVKFAMHFKGTGGSDQLPIFEGPVSEVVA